MCERRNLCTQLIPLLLVSTIFVAWPEWTSADTNSLPPSNWIVKEYLADKSWESHWWKVCIERKDDGWKIMEPCDISNPDAERLAFDLEYSHINLDAVYAGTLGYNNTWKCPIYTRSSYGRDKEKNKYDQCRSAFNVRADFSLWNASYKIDTEQLMQAAKSAGLLDIADRKREQYWLDKYRRTFGAASSKQKLEEFIAAYNANDPEKLAQKAREELARIRYDEYRAAFKNSKSSLDYSNFIKSYKDSDPDKLVPAAIKARDAAVRREAVAENARVRAAHEQKQAQKRNILAFREKLKVGNDSHCGLVVEVKRPVAKIQTMIGERWLKMEQLYPAGYADCRFINGVYREP